MYRIAVTYTPHLKRLMALLAGITALSVFLYGIFLLEAVGNTAKRAGAERSIQSLTTKVGALEAAYLAQTREITLERAHAMGFVAPEQVTTVLAAQSHTTLTLNH